MDAFSERAPEISVVIPVYNVEHYLRGCIDSLLAQTFDDFEIIFVDDGSTDASWDILGEYVERDARLQRIRQERKFAGVARNRGMELARGKYLIFLDSDDFFQPEMLADVYAQAERTQADIVVFNAQVFDNKTHEFRQVKYYLRPELVKEYEVFSAKNMPESIMAFTCDAAWNKLFRREFIMREGLKFQSSHNCNDVFFVRLALCLAERITCIDRVYVNYHKGGKINLQSVRNRTYPFCFVDCIFALRQELISRGLYEQLEQGFVNEAIDLCIDAFRKTTTLEERMLIYRRLNEADFKALGLTEYPEIYYININYYYWLKGTEYALRCYDQRMRVTAAGKPTVLKPIEQFKTPEVSIVVPAYNAALHIAECLDSLLDQTMSNFEVVCVDDGSTDTTLEILTEYAKKDPRITVLMQENAGPSTARNVGAEAARGEYLWFINGDDMLLPTALECLCRRLREDELDAVYFDAVGFPDEDSAVDELSEDDPLREQFRRFQDRCTRRNDYPGIYEGYELLSAFLENKEYRENPCLQMMKRSFYESAGLCFCDGAHEDAAFTFHALMNAKRVGYVHQSLYRWRIRDDSITTSKITYQNVYGNFTSFLEMTRIFQEQLKVHPELAANVEIPALIASIGQAARKQYQQLSEEEKYFYYGLSDYEKTLFKFVVAVGQGKGNQKVIKLQSQVNKLQSRVNKLQKQVNSLKERIEKIKRSKSYRIGRLITWLPRRLIAWLRG